MKYLLCVELDRKELEKLHELFTIMSRVHKDLAKAVVSKIDSAVVKILNESKEEE
jgi:hypothetical protein